MRAESIANYYRVDKQIKRFEDIYQYLCKNELKPEIRHSACSAASIMFPATRMDMVSRNHSIWLVAQP
jgi:alanine racemase